MTRKLFYLTSDPLPKQKLQKLKAIKQLIHVLMIAHSFGLIGHHNHLYLIKISFQEVNMHFFLLWFFAEDHIFKVFKKKFV